MRLLRTVLLLLLLLVPTADATTLRALDLGALVKLSKVIAVVTVRDVDAVRLGGRNWTRATLDVLEPLSGCVAGTGLRTWVPGGDAGGVVQFVSGTPRFEVGRTYLVFLEPEVGGEWQVVGLEQGALALEQGNSGWMLRPSVTAPRLGGLGLGADPLPFDDVVSRVRRLLVAP